MPRLLSNNNAERAEKFYKGGKNIFALEQKKNFGLDLLYSVDQRPRFIVVHYSTQGSEIRPQLQHEREFSISFREGSILREQFGLFLKFREGEHGVFYLDVMDIPLIVWDDSMSHIRFTQTELSSLHNELEYCQKQLAALENLKNEERRDTRSINFYNAEINKKCEEIRNFLTMEYKRITQKEIVLSETQNAGYWLGLLQCCMYLNKVSSALTVDEYQEVASGILQQTWKLDLETLEKGMSLLAQIKYARTLPEDIIENYRKALLRADSNENLKAVLEAIASQYKWHSYTQHWPNLRPCHSRLLDKFNEYQGAIFDKYTPDRANLLQEAAAFNDRCIRFTETFHDFCNMFRLDPPAEDRLVDEYYERFAQAPNDDRVIDEMKQMLSEVALNGRTAGYVGAFRNEIKRLKGYVAAYDAHKKAENIEEAIRNVPLKDRVRMFTHAYSDKCAAVREALAQRRSSKESETLFYRGANGFPMCLNPARAYINVEKEISKYSNVFRSNVSKDSLPENNNLNDRVKEAYNLFYTLPNFTGQVIDASDWKRLYAIGSVPVKEKYTYCLWGGVIYFVAPVLYTRNDTNKAPCFHAMNEFGEPCTMEVHERKGGGSTYIIKDPVSDNACQRALRDLRLLRIHVGKEPLLSDDEYTTCLDHLKVKSNSQENYIIALCELVGSKLRSIGYVCGRQCQHERDAVCTAYKNKILAWINGGQALLSKAELEIQFEILISIFKKYTEFHKIMNETLGENYQIFAKDSAWLEDFSRCDTEDGLAQLVKNANRLEAFQKKVVVFKCRWSGDHDTVVRNCIKNMPNALKNDESWDSFIKEMESRPSNGTDQIEVVRGEIARLYKQNSVSAHKKAKAIDAALGKVPLANRANVLTSDTPECRAVQHVLAAKRPWFSMFEEPKDNRTSAAPDVAKAATAYKNAMSKLNK